MPVYRLLIAYDGSGFHGYARQPNVRTVQGDLETALSRLFSEVETSVAGRTDRGVHASGQVVSFSSDDDVDHGLIVRSLNRQLAPEIAVLHAGEAAPDFSARFSAKARSYIYRVLNRAVPDPFLAATTWQVEWPLDVDLMNAAAASFVGLQDFASLCRRAGERSTVREVRRAEWTRTSDLLEYHVAASSFCHQMVRSMVALCVDVGRGKIDVETVPGMLAAHDRSAARGAAPPPRAHPRRRGVLAVQSLGC